MISLFVYPDDFYPGDFFPGIVVVSGPVPVAPRSRGYDGPPTHRAVVLSLSESKFRFLERRTRPCIVTVLSQENPDNLIREAGLEPLEPLETIEPSTEPDESDSDLDLPDTETLED